MLTLNHLVRRRNDVSAEDFSKYWMEEHAANAIALSPALGIKKYTKCQTLHEDEVNIALQNMYGTGSDAYDFVDQMVINDLGEFSAGLERDDIKSTLRDLHERNSDFVDHSHSDIWFSIDLAQLFPREDICATWDNTYLKVFYVPRRLAHLSLAEAQLHWNSCHGGMARQFANFLPYDKYIQGHRAPSQKIDELKAFLGGEFENLDSIIGQAEAWIDRRVMPTLAGPEVERMMRMLVVDIDLFVEADSSHIFATKEHVIYSTSVITEPVPSLFDVN
jgi:hypothetical protein